MLEIAVFVICRVKERVCQLFEVFQHEFANLSLPCEGRLRIDWSVDCTHETTFPTKINILFHVTLHAMHMENITKHVWSSEKNIIHLHFNFNETLNKLEILNNSHKLFTVFHSFWDRPSSAPAANVFFPFSRKGDLSKRGEGGKAIVSFPPPRPRVPDFFALVGSFVPFASF